MKSASVVVTALLLVGCTATDPALRQALSEVSTRPSAARVKLRPFAEQGNEAAIAQICIAYGRSMDSQGNAGPSQVSLTPTGGGRSAARPWGRSDLRDAERVQAFAWCEHAAAAVAADADAQYFLGRFHAWGIGTAEDRDLALRWYTEAASRGHAEAEDAKRGLEGRSAVCKNWITNCRMF